MKEAMIMNVASVVAGPVAIAVACYVTDSALPLLALMIIPKWTCETSKKED
jgi:hypothetical protein